MPAEGVRFICRDCGKPAPSIWYWLWRGTGWIVCVPCSDKYWEKGESLRDPTKEYRK